MEVLVGTYITHMIYCVSCGKTKVCVMEDKLRDIIPQSPSLIVRFLKNPFNFQVLINLPWLVTASTVILIKYKEMLTGGYRMVILTHLLILFLSIHQIFYYVMA